MKLRSRGRCLNDHFTLSVREHIKNLPKKNCMYTVREMVPDHSGRPCLYVTLHEVRNSLHWVNCSNGEILTEFAFDKAHFVLVNPKEQRDYLKRIVTYYGESLN